MWHVSFEYIEISFSGNNYELSSETKRFMYETPQTVRLIKKEK